MAEMLLLFAFCIVVVVEDGNERGGRETETLVKLL
jgi:hypothetical protein